MIDTSHFPFASRPSGHPAGTTEPTAPGPMSRRAPGSASRARSRPVGHPACRLARAVPVLASLLTTSVFVLWGSVALAQDRPEPTPQPRESKTRVDIPIEKVRVDDGDTIVIVWGEGDEEIVRILGIDTPETQHVEHNIPYDQSFGREAKGFAAGAFGLATRVELLRGATLDPYGRTLGYFYVNGKNYSAAIVAARLAAESVSFYGDNGLPEPAQEVLAAAKTAGPVPFEPPHQYRRRMREVMEHETAH